jgi:hypothetical protein
MQNTGFADMGSVLVETTSGRGFTPEEWAERLLNKIIHVADKAPPAIRDQAIAFREAIRPAIVRYMKEAINSDRTTLYCKLTEAGHPELAKIIGTL